MIKNWNKTGKIKGLIIVIISMTNIVIPYDYTNYEPIIIKSLFPLLFCLIIPILIWLNASIKGREIQRPNWNDNPFKTKNIVSKFQFLGYLFLFIGLSIIISNYIFYDRISTVGPSGFFFGLAILIGNLIVLNWKKLNVYFYIMIGSIVLTSPLFLLKSYTNNKDIISHFNQKFEIYPYTAKLILEEIDSKKFKDDVEYKISSYGNDINYIELENYIYRHKSIELSKEEKSVIDSLLSEIDCSSISFIKNKYVELYSELRNWDLNHIKIIKFKDENIINEDYKEWKKINQGIVPTSRENWLYHLKNNWYIASLVSKNKGNDYNYPFENELNTSYVYYKNGNLKAIGKTLYDKSASDYHKLKHGKWLYLDSNEYIIKKEVYCYDSLKSSITYKESDREKIEKDTVLSITKVNGKWVKQKKEGYIID
jgi:hypothetical protein